MRYFLFFSALALGIVSCKKEAEIVPKPPFREAIVGTYKCDYRHQKKVFFSSGSFGYQNSFAELLVNVGKGEALNAVTIDHNNIGTVLLDSTNLIFDSYYLDVQFFPDQDSIFIKYEQNDTNSYLYYGVKQ